MSVNNAKRPLILKRMILKSQGPNGTKVAQSNSNYPNKKLLKIATIPLYREDVIFESKGEAFLPGEYRSVTIINKLNNFTNNSQTIAKCVTHIGETVEKTSESLTELIGQDSYNTLFYALCSVINQEYRIKGLLSLLTVKPNTIPDKEIPRIVPEDVISSLETAKLAKVTRATQTNETRLEFTKKKEQRRIRKLLVPYVVKPEENNLKKVTIDPYKIIQTSTGSVKSQSPISDIEFNPFKESSFKTEAVDTDLEKKLDYLSCPSLDNGKSLPDLGYLQDDSNDSLKSFSRFSIGTTSDLMINPISLVDDINRHIDTSQSKDQIVLHNHPIMLMDGTVIKVPFKPEDEFHIASKQNLQFLDEPTRKRLLLHQMQIDYKHALNLRDEDGNLPIHLAVINDDIELLKRQCVVLKIRRESVDVPATNGLTALKLSLFASSAQMCGILLSRGADPCSADASHSTSLHHAAEQRTDHLSVLLHHCKMYARNIIYDHVEELQSEGWEKKTDEELSSILLDHMCCSLFDKQGYLPLMLASKLGHYENVRLLLEYSPKSVDVQMPNCGNTALFLAVAAACTAAAERGNKSKVLDHFRKTIEILLESGADPSIENHGGSNVNALLQEFNCAELSMIVANKHTFTKFSKSNLDTTKNFDKYILIKSGNNVSIKEINSKDNKITVNKIINDAKVPIKKSKPVIVENKLIKPSDVKAKNNEAKPLNNNGKNNETILLKSKVKNNDTKQLNSKVKNNDTIQLNSKVKNNDTIQLNSKVKNKDAKQLNNNVKSKDTKALNSNVKQAIWYPLKRKADDETDSKKNKEINAKKTKINK